MATSPLSLYEQFAKEAGITGEIDQPNEFKLAFIKEQIEQIKAIMWRNSVDMIVSQKNADAETSEELKNAHMDKVREYSTKTKKMAQSLQTFIELRDELAAKVDE